VKEIPSLHLYRFVIVKILRLCNASFLKQMENEKKSKHSHLAFKSQENEWITKESRSCLSCKFKSCAEEFFCIVADFSSVSLETRKCQNIILVQIQQVAAAVNSCANEPLVSCEISV
jgi:hypothetical protein